MSKEEFKQELEKHDLTINHFLDLRDEWYKLDASEQFQLLKEEKCDD